MCGSLFSLAGLNSGNRPCVDVQPSLPIFSLPLSLVLLLDFVWESPPFRCFLSVVKDLATTGSAAGASGTRPQFLKDILSCSNKAVAGSALATLTRLTNHMVAGLAPRELAPFIAGAPLMALVKQGGGLRPIAIGETIRRLVSKCCCEATSEDAQVFFGPLQVGVGWG